MEEKEKEDDSKNIQSVEQFDLQIDPTWKFSLNGLIKCFKSDMENYLSGEGHDTNNYKIKYPIRLEPNEGNELKKMKFYYLRVIC